jgi:hypothetical protein
MYEQFISRSEGKTLLVLPSFSAFSGYTKWLYSFYMLFPILAVKFSFRTWTLLLAYTNGNKDPICAASIRLVSAFHKVQQSLPNRMATLWNINSVSFLTSFPDFFFLNFHCCRHTLHGLDPVACSELELTSETMKLSRVRFPAGGGNFSLHHPVQNGSEAHPASYPIGTTGSFPGSKAAGAWSWPVTFI